jgi:hypothetical protein
MRSFFLKKKQPGNNAERSPPPIAEVMNDWTCTTIPTLCLQAEYRYNITSTSNSVPASSENFYAFHIRNFNNKPTIDSFQ